MRGQRLTNAIIDAMRPTIMTPISIRELDEAQNSDGANQKRFEPRARATAARYSPAGSTPCGAINPLIWKSNEKNAEKYHSARVRKKIQRGISRSAGP